MYLKGSSWSMRRKRKPVNWLRVFILSALIGIALYFNQNVVPEIPPIGIPSPTPTRSPESFVNEAENYFKEGKLLKAVETYQSAIRSDPDNRENYLKLAVLQAIQAVGKDYTEALQNANLALVGNDSYALGHAVKGWILNLNGDYLEAETSLKKALELEPNNPIILAYYAETLINKGEYGDVEKAIQASREALAMGPNLYETHRARGIVLFSTGNYEEAIQEFQNALNINKSIPDLYLYLGYCYRAVGDYGRANESFLQANALNPSDSIPDLEISRTYATVGEFSKAVQYAQKAVEEEPRNPHRYGNLGIMYYKNQQNTEAVDALSICIKGGVSKNGEPVEGLPLDRGRVVQYYYTYGLALARLNRCAEAVPIMQAIINAIPDDEIAVYNANEGLNMCKANLETPQPAPQEGTPPSETSNATPNSAVNQPTKPKQPTQPAPNTPPEGYEQPTPIE